MPSSALTPSELRLSIDHSAVPILLLLADTITETILQFDWYLIILCSKSLQLRPPMSPDPYFPEQTKVGMDIGTGYEANPLPAHA